MKAVILCGGQGSRLQEETERLPKPMVEIGSKPILWHIMKIYSHYGINEFILCLGYKQNIIREYFYHYFFNNANVTIYVGDSKYVDRERYDVHSDLTEKWQITLVNTGENTATGGRLGRVKEFISNDEFMLTYGDGLSDVNITKLLQFHQKHSWEGEIVTLTAVPSAGRFGVIELGKYDHVDKFVEKPDKNHLINGGFFVMEPKIFNYIEGDQTDLADVLKKLSEEKRLVAYKHTGYWKCMDTLKDKKELEEEWIKGARWKVWK